MIKSQNSLFYVRRNKLEACPTFHKIKCASVYLSLCIERLEKLFELYTQMTAKTPAKKAGRKKGGGA
jgi:hypothetical protein